MYNGPSWSHIIEYLPSAYLEEVDSIICALYMYQKIITVDIWITFWGEHFFHKPNLFYICYFKSLHNIMTLLYGNKVNSWNLTCNYQSLHANQRLSTRQLVWCLVHRKVTLLLWDSVLCLLQPHQRQLCTLEFASKWSILFQDNSPQFLYYSKDPINHKS